MTVADPRWLEPSPPLAIDEDDVPEPEPRPDVPPPDSTPEDTSDQGSQD